MPKQKTSKEVYKECDSQGRFRDQEIVNIDKIKTMIEIADAKFNSAELLKKRLRKD